MNGKNNQYPDWFCLKFDKKKIPTVGCPFWGVVPDHFSHEQAEIKAQNVNQLAFFDIFPTAQPYFAHATPVEGVLETLFSEFRATFR